MSKAKDAAELVGTLEALSGLVFPHAAEARVLGGVDVYAVEVTVTGLRSTRTVSAVDFGGLEREMAPDAWTDALQSDVTTALFERPVETGPPPAAVRRALEQRGYRGPEPGEQELLQWRHLRVDVVLVDFGPMGEPLFVLVAREPIRWLGTVSRTLPNVRNGKFAHRGMHAPTPRVMRWLGGSPRENAVSSVVGLLIVAGLSAWLAPGVNDSSPTAVAWLSLTGLATLAALPLLIDRPTRKALFARMGECRCDRCESRRERGAARVASESMTSGGWDDLYTEDAHDGDGAPVEETVDAGGAEGRELEQLGNSETRRDVVSAS
jgi:hypothetical protein